MTRDRPCERGRMDVLAQVDCGSQDLEVLAREHCIVRSVDGVSAYLNRVLRGAHDRGADAFAGGRKRPGERAVADQALEGFSQGCAEIAEEFRLLAVNVLA